jgi:hypothetical protein
MKFNMTWLEEKNITIDAVDVDAAETYGVALIKRLGGFPKAKLLSILPVLSTNDKPPTPFGKPPSGTLGGGQVKVAEALPDVRAA